MQTRALLALAALLPLSALAQTKPAPPKSVRLYIFDCGVIKGLSVTSFNFKEGEIPARDMVVPCYLIVHPRGTLMWDVGVLPDSLIKTEGVPVTQGISTITRTLKSQLAAIGYKPSDMTYLAFSHYHSDHTANANDFASATWLARQPDRDAMFAEQAAAIMDQSSYSALKTAKTVIIKTDDYDVFGDGTVILKSAPGHTPGHQVLFLKLAQTGPVVLGGDLYHLPEEKTMNRFPTFEYSVEQSRASRAAIDAFVEKNKAQFWIEHDAATYAKQKKSPEFYQ
ncbi:MAG TPA: N-acyl homoserine lactonase family protein [Bryobacteraceae bacterium]|jgi:glyoxylase-like metal-dependent hydrolase (beta-lactamase superfamily II)